MVRGALRFQLFASYTLPEGSICTPVLRVRPLKPYPALRGEIEAPVFLFPGGQSFGRAPQTWDRRRSEKFATQAVSSPSTATPGSRGRVALNPTLDLAAGGRGLRREEQGEENREGEGRKRPADDVEMSEQRRSSRRY